MNSIEKIPKRKIITVFEEIPVDEDLKRLSKLKKRFNLFDKVIPVEKDPERDLYYLVGRYQTFKAIYNDNDDVYCLVEDYTSEKGQLIKIAQRFLYQNTKSETRQKMIDHLVRFGLSENDIVKLTYFQPSQMNSYVYGELVPHTEQSLNENLGRPGTIAAINRVSRLQKRHCLSDKLTSVLYKRIRDNVLTIEQLNAITKMLKNTKGFQALKFDNQIKVINFVMINQAFLFKKWQAKINQLLLE